MKKNKLFAVAAAVIMLAPVTLNSLTEKTADAAIVGTTTNVALTYDANGKATSNALQAGSKWILGDQITVDGTNYYQVATNVYVPASSLTDITDTTKTDNNTTTNNEDATAGKTMYVKATTTIVDDNAAATSATLAAGSAWKIGKTMTVNGISYYQVATNQWVKASDMAEKVQTTTPTYKTPMPGDGLTATLTKAQRVYNPETNSYGSTLPVGSAWKIDKLVVNKYGSYWGEVATNQYVWITDTTLNSGLSLKDNSNYIADFATKIN